MPVCMARGLRNHTVIMLLFPGPNVYQALFEGEGRLAPFQKHDIQPSIPLTPHITLPALDLCCINCRQSNTQSLYTADDIQP
jgi:hypothetical protein